MMSGDVAAAAAALLLTSGWEALGGQAGDAAWSRLAQLAVRIRPRMAISAQAQAQAADPRVLELPGRLLAAADAAGATVPRSVSSWSSPGRSSRPAGSSSTTRASGGSWRSNTCTAL